MSRIKQIRALLGNPSQAELAEAMGCVQTNISHYEKGQRLPADRAAKLIEFASRKGLTLTLDQIYGLQPLPQVTAGA